MEGLTLNPYTLYGLGLLVEALDPEAFLAPSCEALWALAGKGLGFMVKG